MNRFYPRQDLVFGYVSRGRPEICAESIKHNRDTIPYFSNIPIYIYIEEEEIAAYKIEFEKRGLTNIQFIKRITKNWTISTTRRDFIEYIYKQGITYLFLCEDKIRFKNIQEGKEKDIFDVLDDLNNRDISVLGLCFSYLAFSKQISKRSNSPVIFEKELTSMFMKASILRVKDIMEVGNLCHWLKVGEWQDLAMRLYLYGKKTYFFSYLCFWEHLKLKSLWNKQGWIFKDLIWKRRGYWSLQQFYEFSDIYWSIYFKKPSKKMLEEIWLNVKAIKKDKEKLKEKIDQLIKEDFYIKWRPYLSIPEENMIKLVTEYFEESPLSNKENNKTNKINDNLTSVKINNKYNWKKYIFLDWDGVLTDNTVFIWSNWDSFKQFNWYDSIACAELKKMWFIIYIISKDHYWIMDKRAKTMKVDYISCPDNKTKLEIYDLFIKKNKIDNSTVIYVGDSILDLWIIQKVWKNSSFCPENSMIDVKTNCHYCFKWKGWSWILLELLSAINS